MEIREQIEAARLVAIIRGNFEGNYRAMAEGLIAGGVQVMEITLNSPGALEAIRIVAAEHGDKLLIGAGTVLEPDQVAQVASAGGKFVISPALLPDVIRAAQDHGLEAVPGTLTPTEILQAQRAGARLIKVFPALAGGPDYLRQVLGPLDDAHLMPTGGVDETNARAYLDAGAVAVGVTSALVSSAFDGSPDAVQHLTMRARRLMDIVHKRPVSYYA